MLLPEASTRTRSGAGHERARSALLSVLWRALASPSQAAGQGSRDGRAVGSVRRLDGLLRAAEAAASEGLQEDEAVGLGGALRPPLDSQCTESVNLPTMAFPPEAEAGLKKWAKARGFGELKKELAGKPGVKAPEKLAAAMKLKAGGKGKFVKKMTKAGAMKLGEAIVPTK